MRENAKLSELFHFFKGLDPVADAFAGTVYSDIASLKHFRRIAWLVYKGVGTTGTSTITVQGCDDNSPTTTGAVPFYYRAITSTDVPGTLTACAATGFVTTAGSSQLYIVEIDVQALLASGYAYARLKMVESVDAAVLGCIVGLLADPRDTYQVGQTQLA